MKVIKRLMFACLHIPFVFRQLTGTGAFGHRQARYIDPTGENDANPLKAALFRYHVKQYHEASCSVATVVSVVNALKSLQDQSFKPILQLEILEKVQAGNWKKRMSEAGDNGRRGLPLALLGEVVLASLAAYRIDCKRVETVPVEKQARQSKGQGKVLWERLADFEKYGNGLILAHFDQGAWVKTLNIPHISPVGGFDVRNGNVTILDVDPDQKKPYNISFDTFCRGVSSNYNHLFRPFGIGSGGYIYIERA